MATGLGVATGAGTRTENLIVIDACIGPTWELRCIMAGLAQVGTTNMSTGLGMTGRTGAEHLIVINGTGRDRPGGSGSC